MRLLIDHCLDWRLSRSLPGHTVKAVGKVGWSHLKDGPLLAKAQLGFDVLVTSDKKPALPAEPLQIQFGRGHSGRSFKSD